MTLLRFAFSATTVAFAVAACGDDDSDDTKVGNGVNDVVQSCQIRSTWKREGTDCSICEAAVTTARCDCSELKDYSAACIDQQDARKKVCAESIDTCVFACARTDCTCIAACYANDAACKTASDARDGCIAEACASHCK